MKFKKGDKVICTDTGYESFLDLHGKIVTISRVQELGRSRKYWMLSFEELKGRCYNAEYFELEAVINSPLMQALS